MLINAHPKFSVVFGNSVEVKLKYFNPAAPLSEHGHSTVSLAGEKQLVIYIETCMVSGHTQYTSLPVVCH